MINNSSRSKVGIGVRDAVALVTDIRVVVPLFWSTLAANGALCRRASPVSPSKQGFHPKPRPDHITGSGYVSEKFAAVLAILVFEFIVMVTLLLWGFGLGTTVATAGGLAAAAAEVAFRLLGSGSGPSGTRPA